jgi:hypothetical protein
MSEAKTWLLANAPDFVNKYVEELQNLNTNFVLQHLSMIDKLTSFETKILSGVASINEIEQQLNLWKAERENILQDDNQYEEE